MYRKLNVMKKMHHQIWIVKKKVIFSIYIKIIPSHK